MKSYQNLFMFNRFFSQLFVTSALLIIIVIFAVIVYFYPTIDGILEKQLYSNNDAVIHNVQRLLDTQLYNIYKLPVEIANNPKLSKYYLMKSQYNIRDGHNELKKYILTNTFIDDCFLFIPDTNYYITKNGLNKVDDTYNKFANYTNQDIFKLVVEAKKKKILPSQTITYYNGYPYNIISFILPIEKSHNSLMVTVKEKTIINILELSAPNHQGGVAVLDQNNKILAKTSGINTTIINELTSKYDITNFDVAKKYEISGKTYVISNGSSKNLALNYLSIVPYNEFIKDIRRTQIINIIFIIAVFIVTLIIAFYISKMNYKPTKKLLGMMGIDSKTKKSNEYEIIENKINLLNNNFDKLNNSYNTLLPSSRKHIIRNLIHGNITSIEQLNKMGENSNLNIQGKYFKITLLKYISDTNTNIYLKTLSNLSFPKGITGSIIGGYGKNTYILFTGCNHKTDVIKFIKNIYKETVNESEYRTYITTSEFYNNISKTNTIHSKIIQLLDYQILKSRTGILDQYKFPDINSFTKYPSKLIYHFKMSLLSYDIYELKNNYKEIIKILNNENSCVSLIRMLVYDTYNVLFNYNKDNLELSIQDIDKTSFIYSKNCSLNEMIEIVDDQLDLVIQAKVTSSKTNKNNMYYILEYINMNYTKYDISLKNVADNFNMTPSNLSHYFKKHTGVNFLAYIKHLRIDKAKKLLINSTLSIAEIGERTGFISNTSFTRVFKDLAHQSPSNFRNNNNN